MMIMMLVILFSSSLLEVQQSIVQFTMFSCGIKQIKRLSHTTLFPLTQFVGLRSGAKGILAVDAATAAAVHQDFPFLSFSTTNPSSSSSSSCERLRNTYLLSEQLLDAVGSMMMMV
jgi:hypothetical protein